MLRAILIAALVLALAACARTMYRHPDYTPQKWATDSYECERDMRQSGYFGTGIYGAMNRQEFFDRCLGARG